MADPLYKDKQLSVQVCANADGHILSFGNNNYFFDRSLLKDLTQTPRGSLENKLELVNPGIMINAQENGLTADSIGVALAQARIAELEEELSHAYVSLSLLRK
jgi:hypothetical protein